MKAQKALLFYLALLLFASFGACVSAGGDRCAVSFDLNYSGAPKGPAAKSVAFCEGVSAPKAPTRVGYEFEGWYREASGKSAWNFETGSVTSTMTLYAKWAKLSTVKVSYAEALRVWEGFGGALCYDQASITGSAGRDKIYQLLFKDLGLDVLRVKNTYGSDDDATQATINIVKAAKAANPSLRVELLPWSPPKDLKSTKSVNRGTLVRNADDRYAYAEYGAWWANSLEAWEKAGVTPDYVTIQNEPDFEATYDACVLRPAETADAASYKLAFEAVLAAFATKKAANPAFIVPKLIGPETMGFTGAIDYIKSFSPADLSQIYAFSFHPYADGDGPNEAKYDNPDGYLRPIKDFVAFSAPYNKPLIMTEFVRDGKPEFDHAVKLAWHISNFVNEMGVSAYYHWSLLRSYGTGGFINIENGPDPVVRDLYYFYKHYAYFTDPGYLVLKSGADSSGLRVTAFKSPAGDKVTVVALNISKGDEKVKLDLGGKTVADSALYRSSANEHWKSLGALDASGYVSVPAESIVTLSLTVK